MNLFFSGSSYDSVTKFKSFHILIIFTVLRWPFAKVRYMLSQQIKSIIYLKLEDGNLQLLLSSNAVANYNIQRDSILCHQSPTRPLTPNNKASLLPVYGRDTHKSLCPLLQRSTVEPLLPVYGRLDLQLTPLTWICSYFGYCSQSTTCNATRFGECSSTLLDKLWYTYSCIYKPTTTTIHYGIYIFFNSRHTGPFWLLPCVKYTTPPSTSTPLFTTLSFTTCYKLQLSILLESVSAPSLLITSGTFFVNFIQSIIFLSLAGVNKEDNDPESATEPDIQYKFESLHASPFQFPAILNQATISSLPTPLSTTRSTSLSSAVLNSASASSSPLSSGLCL